MSVEIWDNHIPFLGILGRNCLFLWLIICHLCGEAVRIFSLIACIAQQRWSLDQKTFADEQKEVESFLLALGLLEALLCSHNKICFIF
jgi:hypothetical protein